MSSPTWWVSPGLPQVQQLRNHTDEWLECQVMEATALGDSPFENAWDTGPGLFPAHGSVSLTGLCHPQPWQTPGCCPKGTSQADLLPRAGGLGAPAPTVPRRPRCGRLWRRWCSGTSTRVRCCWPGARPAPPGGRGRRPAPAPDGPRQRVLGDRAAVRSEGTGLGQGSPRAQARCRQRARPHGRAGPERPL